MIGKEILWWGKGTLLLYFHDDLVRVSYYHIMKEVYIQTIGKMMPLI